MAERAVKGIYNAHYYQVVCQVQSTTEANVNVCDFRGIWPQTEIFRPDDAALMKGWGITRIILIYFAGIINVCTNFNVMTVSICFKKKKKKESPWDMSIIWLEIADIASLQEGERRKQWD